MNLFYNPSERVFKCQDCNYEDGQSTFRIIGGEELAPGVTLRKFLKCPECDMVVIDPSYGMYTYLEIE